MLLQMALFHSFLRLSNIPLYVYTYICITSSLSFSPLMDGKRRSKTVTADDMMLYIEYPKDATRKLLEFTHKFGKVARHKVNTDKSVFLHPDNKRPEREIKETTLTQCQAGCTQSGGTGWQVPLPIAGGTKESPIPGEQEGGQSQDQHQGQHQGRCQDQHQGQRLSGQLRAGSASEATCLLSCQETRAGELIPVTCTAFSQPHAHQIQPPASRWDLLACLCPQGGGELVAVCRRKLNF